MSDPIHKPYLIIVEGKDDQFFFEAMCRHLGFDSVQVREVRGKPSYQKKIETITRLKGYEDLIGLGLVRDSDSNPEDSLRSMQAALENIDLPVPTAQLDIERGSKNTIIFTVPNASESGEIEDLILKSLVDDTALNCVGVYFSCLAVNTDVFPKKESKAKIQAFLASREETGFSLGVASKKGYWHFDHEAFSGAREFVQKLVS